MSAKSIATISPKDQLCFSASAVPKTLSKYCCWSTITSSVVSGCSFSKPFSCLYRSIRRESVRSYDSTACDVPILSPFMPDLLWSGWVCLATPTLPPDASGSLLAATVTPSALPVLQPHFSSHLPLPVAGPRRQGAHA